MRHFHFPRRQRGLSLVECAITMTIVMLVAGFALPSFDQLRQRRQLESTAAQLETDLQLARSEAVARHEGVRVTIEKSPAGSCYVVHTGSKGSCKCLDAPAPVCEPGSEALRSVMLQAVGMPQLQSTTSLLFDPDKGTVTPTGTLKLKGEIGTVHLVVNVMGRIRACSPTGMPGYRAC